jgi:hypothetical protein
MLGQPGKMVFNRSQKNEKIPKIQDYPGELALYGISHGKLLKLSINLLQKWTKNMTIHPNIPDTFPVFTYCPFHS